MRNPECPPILAISGAATPTICGSLQITLTSSGLYQLSDYAAAQSGTVTSNVT